MTRDELIKVVAAALAARGHALDAEYTDLTGEYVEATDYSETAAVAVAAALPVAVEAALARMERALTATRDDYDGDSVLDRAHAELAAIRAEWGQL